MRAVILAAGSGRRLGLPFPKCLARLGGRTILDRQLAAFAARGISEYVIVVGFEQQQIRDYLRTRQGQFTFVVNERYSSTNTIYSLYLAREHIPGPFFYANADVLFDHRLLERLDAAPGPAALAVIPGRCGEEEVKVIVQAGRIIRISKKLPPAECLGEFLGVARFGVEAARPLFRLLERYIEHRRVVADYFERAVNRLCHHWPLTPVDVRDLPCQEIDFPEDLAHAEHQVVARLID